MIKESIRSMFDLARAPDPPRASRWDWLLIAVLVAWGVLGALYGSNVTSGPVEAGLGALLPVALLWRRSHPLAALVLAFAATQGAFLATYFAVGSWTWPAVPVLVSLILTYALFRWGSGHEMTVGLVIILVAAGVSGEVLDAMRSANEVAFAFAFSLLPAAVGLTMRYRADAHLGRIRDARRAERERLARELHDTVAHHVSAIAVQAQAAGAVFASDPQAAANALRVIEHAASSTLTDMRAIVGALRDGEEADKVPQRGLRDIERLATAEAAGPTVDVTLSGRLEDLGPTVEAGLYRLAQESLTNVRRHARQARRVLIAVEASDDRVTLTVRDDGHPAPRRGGGYGLIGMEERAELLGGRFVAGPEPDGGWQVHVDLPRNGARVT